MFSFTSTQLRHVVYELDMELLEEIDPEVGLRSFRWQSICFQFAVLLIMFSRWMIAAKYCNCQGLGGTNFTQEKKPCRVDAVVEEQRKGNIYSRTCSLFLVNMDWPSFSLIAFCSFIDLLFIGLISFSCLTSPLTLIVGKYGRHRRRTKPKVMQTSKQRQRTRTIPITPQRIVEKEGNWYYCLKCLSVVRSPILMKPCHLMWIA